MAMVALEGALGDVAPGRAQVLQHIQVETLVDRQLRLAALFSGQQQVFLDGVDQGLRVDAQ